MRGIGWAVALVLVCSVAACGGGNKTSTSTITGSSTAVAFFTGAPAAITFSSLSQDGSYVLGGGVKPYSASSGNSAVVTAATSGSSVTLNSRGVGSAKVVLSDAAGSKIELDVTVVNAAVSALRTSVPSGLSIVTSTTYTYSISGGSSPYSVASNKPAVVAATISGSSLSVSGIAVGTAVVTVTDAAGTPLQTEVSVVAASGSGGALYSTAPASVTLTNGGAPATYSVGGGTGPYGAATSNATVVTASVSGSTLTLTPVGTGVGTVVITDSVGAKIELAATVGPTVTSSLVINAPSPSTIPIDGNASFPFQGGVSPFIAASSNTAIATVSAGTNSLLVNGVSNGTAQITVFDAHGTQATITVVVGTGTAAPLYVSAPSTLTLQMGSGVSTYAVGGGTATYSASSSNLSKLTASINGTSLQINPGSPGTATVTVTDSVGATKSIDVTVSPSGTTALTLLPASGSGNVGDVLRFKLSGGLAPYSLTVSNASKITASSSTVSSSGDEFTLSLLSAGDSVVTITDASGQTLSLPVSISVASTSLRLSPSAFTIGENSTGTVDLTIYGGTGSYSALTSDYVKTAVSVIGGSSPPTVRIGVGSATNFCINPVDDSDAYQRGAAYDVIITVIDSNGASATSVMSIKDNSAGLGAGCP